MEYRLTTTKQAFIAIIRAFGIAIISVVILFAIARAVTRTTNTIVTTRNDFAAFTKKHGMLDQLARDYELIKDATTQLDGAIPTMDNATVVADYLTATAARTANTVALHFDSSVKASEGTPLTELGFSMRVEGNTASLLEFLRKIESAPYLITVKNISLSFDNALTGPVSAQMSAAVYLNSQK